MWRPRGPLGFHLHTPWSQVFVSLIEVMYCLFYWSCVLSRRQCRVHSLACTFPLSEQTLDLCFEAFIRQKHPLRCATCWKGRSRNKNAVGVPLTHNIPIMPTQTGMCSYTGHAGMDTLAHAYTHTRTHTLKKLHKHLKLVSCPDTHIFFSTCAKIKYLY